ncbi:MAG: hypothetical protein KAI50_10655 [Desulfobacterales bacterium]|nr:hypothetical protein [Desulfobacterales bacterium]
MTDNAVKLFIWKSIGDRKMLEDMLTAIKELSEKFSEVRQVLNNFGLL